METTQFLPHSGLLPGWISRQIVSSGLRCSAAFSTHPVRTQIAFIIGRRVADPDPVLLKVGYGSGFETLIDRHNPVYI